SQCTSYRSSTVARRRVRGLHGGSAGSAAEADRAGNREGGLRRRRTGGGRGRRRRRRRDRGREDHGGRLSETAARRKRLRERCDELCPRSPTGVVYWHRAAQCGDRWITSEPDVIEASAERPAQLGF